MEVCSEMVVAKKDEGRGNLDGQTRAEEAVPYD